MARVSGWASPSSPARAVAAPPRLPSPPCSDLAATATAADPRPWPRSRGGGRRGTAARWNRRTGAEGLPRGVVETSSDRFLRSLWDSTSKHADTKVRSAPPLLTAPSGCQGPAAASRSNPAATNRLELASASSSDCAATASPSKMAKATLLVYCTSPFVYWSCHQSHIVEISDSEFQFRCLNGQFLTASNQDVISATTDSPGDSETFYIERNNTMLHIKLSNGSYLQVTDNNQLTSNYRSQPGWGDDMATFQMTIAANNLHGDYQLANGYRPVQAKAVLTEHRQNTIPEMRTALVASKSAGPYLIALCLYMIAARFF